LSNFSPLAKLKLSKKSIALERRTFGIFPRVNTLLRQGYGGLFFASAKNKKTADGSWQFCFSSESDFFSPKTALFFPLKGVLLFPLPLFEIRKLKLTDLTFPTTIEDLKFKVKIASAFL